MRKQFRFLQNYIKLPLRNYVSFDLIWKVLFLMFIFPIFYRAIHFVIELWGKSYLTKENLTEFLWYPPTVFTIILIGVILSLLVFFELYGLHYYMQKESSPRKIPSFFNGVNTYLRRNLILPVFSLLFYILLHFPILCYQLISDFISHSPKIFSGFHPLPLAILLSLLFILCICYPGLFTFHYLVVERKNFRTCYQASRASLHGHHTKTMTILLVTNLILTIFVHFFQKLTQFLATYVINVFATEEYRLHRSLEMLPKVHFITVIILSMFALSLNFNIISTLFIKYTTNPSIKSANYDRVQMTKIIIFILLLALSVGNIHELFHHTPYQFLYKNPLGIEITAHRGFSACAPENTLPALQRAIESGADWVEFDIQQIKDGTLILLHDKKLKRTAGLNEYAYNLTYKQIKKLDVGSWFSDDFIHTKIPTLEEVIKLCQGKIHMKIEIKTHGYEENLEEDIVQIIEKYHLEQQCSVSSQNDTMLARIKRLNSEIKTGLIMKSLEDLDFSLEHIDFYCLRYNLIDTRIVNEAHREGKKIHAWTVNDPFDFECMKALNVDNITTDHPTLALKTYLNLYSLTTLK